jgi:hypothetical protein
MEPRPYSLDEIEEKLWKGHLPFSGITPLGSSSFYFDSPAFYAGVSMHSGHRVRDEILDFLAVSEEDRFREEDPYMDRFISDLPIRIYGRDSRFEYDLNRNPYQALYDFGEPKWGLNIWKREVTRDAHETSIRKHREFHELLELVCRYLLRQNRHALLFDLHAYCYQRETRQSWFEDERPDINIGTGAVNREVFEPAIGCFKSHLKTRHLSRMYHDRLLLLALEYKKIFMNERTAELYPDVLEKLILDFNRAVDRTVHTCLTVL